jgi:hypothetical protein
MEKLARSFWAKRESSCIYFLSKQAHCKSDNVSRQLISGKGLAQLTLDGWAATHLGCLRITEDCAHNPNVLKTGLKSN